jgi:hypothetical protein
MIAWPLLSGSSVCKFTSESSRLVVQISTKLPLSLRGAHRAPKQSRAGEFRWARDCFACARNDSWNWWRNLIESCSNAIAFRA